MTTNSPGPITPLKKWSPCCQSCFTNSPHPPIFLAAIFYRQVIKRKLKTKTKKLQCRTSSPNTTLYVPLALGQTQGSGCCGQGFCFKLTAHRAGVTVKQRPRGNCVVKMPTEPSHTFQTTLFRPSWVLLYGFTQRQ